MPNLAIWLIFLLPLFSFILISFVLRPFFSHRPLLSGYTCIISIFGSLILSLWLLWEIINAPEHKIEIPRIQWVLIEEALTIHIGLILDALTGVMVVIVSFISLMVQIYSLGYMWDPENKKHGHKGFCRYFAFMSLFTGSMLGLVMADNLLFLFLFWEGVGLCSYLLIGFWFHKPEAANAAKKAFIVTRAGDFGFLLAILYLYLKTGTFYIPELHHLAQIGALSGVALTWACIGIFSGAVGKSAQFPLHVWLPDAMEGPTPVSALIHAATMVAAGAFLVARNFPLFFHSDIALTIVACIGGFTALFAATMGLVMTDIKRVIAYSTISQLGYMMVGLGAGSMAFAIFHLFNHAFFKALLFLGAGSANHATETFDIREMGGLRRYMPWTNFTFLVAALSLGGIWPLSGFWSKDFILYQAWKGAPFAFYLTMATAFFTSLYIFRVYFMVFGGEYRGKAHHIHESPKVMLFPMVLLALGSIFSGWLWGQFIPFLGGEVKYGFFTILTSPIALLSLLFSGLGILTAYALYSAKWISVEKIRGALPHLHTLLVQKYYFDHLYERVITMGIFVNGLFRGLEIIDSSGVDRTVDKVAGGTISAGRTIRKAQVGQLQFYGLAIIFGLIAILLALYLWG